MNFELLISTMHKNTEEVFLMLERLNVKCNVLIVVQGDEEEYQEIKKAEQVIRILFSRERGLSKSRNMALRNCSAEFGYIMDDDVLLEDNAIESVVKSMIEDDVDVGTTFFNYEDGRVSKPGLNYSFYHNLLTAAKVSSIEICIRINSVRESKVLFDERFGLGADLSSGEEYIFITDCLKRELRVRYYPLSIGTHPNITSGQDFYTSSSKVFAKREMLKRVFNFKSPIYILAFWIKKLPEVIRAGYGLKFTKTMLLGLK